MTYELTQHAAKVLDERGIALEWMERTLNDPQWISPDPNDPSVERHFRSIPEFGGRVLRVAVNTTVSPNRVVSVFFDRTQKGKP
ncbi:MAG: DUF4258 domain-containing protein [Phycisphaerales bacterium]|jgi:hypothetical protein|nr:DUF4258 domain-containing protein [Phycisphaerales bacterium]